MAIQDVAGDKMYEGRVDTPITWCAPHRSGRAAFPHPALEAVKNLVSLESESF